MKYSLSKTLSHTVRCFLVALLLSVLTACASSSDQPLHSFKFDATRDSPDIEVLDYRYCTVQVGPTQPDKPSLERGKIRQSAGVGGYFPRGDSLYVKWRIRSTSQIYEDTVDLKSRLPYDITGNTIYFIVKESVLMVYLVTREPRPPEMAPQGPEQTQYRKTYVIYPDNLSTLKK